MPDPSIIVEHKDRVLVVLLNNPEKRNALSGKMLEELADLFSKLENQSDTRAVVLSGSGNRAFCSGTDINQLAGLTERQALETSVSGQRACDAIERSAVPVIAAVNGAAAGGGLELALACHIRIAAAEASFSIPEVRLGAIPAYGGTQRLRRIIGEGRANELVLTGATIDAERAMRIGLVNRVVESDRAVDAALRMADEISQCAPLAVRACLKAVIGGAELPLAEGLELEAKLFSQLFNTEDVREGTRAFLEKRQACFKGK